MCFIFNWPFLKNIINSYRFMIHTGLIISVRSKNPSFLRFQNARCPFPCVIRRLSSRGWKAAPVSSSCNVCNLNDIICKLTFNYICAYIYYTHFIKLIDWLFFAKLIKDNKLSIFLNLKPTYYFQFIQVF